MRQERLNPRWALVRMPSPGTGPAPVRPPQVRQGHPRKPPWSVTGLSNTHDHSVTATPQFKCTFLELNPGPSGYWTFMPIKSRRQPVVVLTPVDSQLRPLPLPICTTVAETGSQSPVQQSTVSFPLNQGDALVRTPTLPYLRIT